MSCSARCQNYVVSRFTVFDSRLSASPFPTYYGNCLDIPGFLPRLFNWFCCCSKRGSSISALLIILPTYLLIISVITTNFTYCGDTLLARGGYKNKEEAAVQKFRKRNWMSACLLTLLSLLSLIVLLAIGIANCFHIKSDQGPGTCILTNCSEPTVACVLKEQCRNAVFCNYKCQNKKNQEACNLLCELNYGYNSTEYRSLMQCMSDHGCLPVSPSDGILMPCQ